MFKSQEEEVEGDRKGEVREAGRGKNKNSVMSTKGG